jgi:hypothetical protein
MEETEEQMFMEAFDADAIVLNKPRVSCTCKKSFCLKKYCVCFAAGLSCDKTLCSCLNCGVDPEKNRAKSKYFNSKYIRKRDRVIPQPGMLTPEKRLKVSMEVKVHPKSGKLSFKNVSIYDPIDAANKTGTDELLISSIQDILSN